MTEADWLACSKPMEMVAFLRGKASFRKLRLFACACCRNHDRFGDERLRRTLEVAELYADKLCSVQDFEETRVASAAISWNRPWDSGPGWLRQDAWVAASNAYSDALRDQRFTWKDVLRFNTSLLGHIFGNPFRPSPPGPDLPTAAMDLALALYAGEPCAFALHDALLDAGHAELAEHFREPEHPKGCWALDLILGKT